MDNYGSVENLVRANAQNYHPRQRGNGGTRVEEEEECAKKTFILYIQSWLAREDVGRMARTTKEESEGPKGRESYLVKINETVSDLRKCDLYPMLSGYREIKRWFGAKLIFIIHGNPGCEIWFRRFADLSKTGRIWEMN